MTNKTTAEMENEIEQLQVQLAGVSTAALGGIKGPAKEGDYGWSVAYQDTLDLRLKYEINLIEIEDLRLWVNDLHSGMYVNCVYCGHRYGPEDEIDNMQEALTSHVEKCPKHPLSKARDEVEFLKRKSNEYKLLSEGLTKENERLRMIIERRKINDDPYI
jgi:hypothetical protein